MILKIRTGWEQWKYLDDIKDPEVEVTDDLTLAFRLGYTLDRLKELDIHLAPGELHMSLLDKIQPIDCMGMYSGQVSCALYSLVAVNPNTVEIKAGEILDPKASVKGKSLLAITCSRSGVKHHIFTDCETYLLNDQGKNINRLL
jgi:hypothetical protein